MDLVEKIKQKGLELGYTHVGITSADDFTEYEEEILSREDYAMWTDEDRSKYPDRSDLRLAARPKTFWPEAKSIICFTWGYSQCAYPEELLPYVARAYLSRAYGPLPDSAAGVRLQEFKRYIESLGIGIYEGPNEVPARMACARAGIITYGKNNFAFTKEDGSFNILNTFIVDKELPCDEPTVKRQCPENCHKCIDACPSHAIMRPGRLHPQRCMMHNNQLKMGELPQERWDMLGVHIHGCDECQVACPKNSAALKRAAWKDPLLEKLKDKFDLEKILFLDDDYYEEVVYPIMYNYIRDMDIFRRNAAIAMGNSGNAGYLPALKKAAEIYDGGVTEAAEWAIEKLEKIPG
ncbi:MAG: epoxyqueuosine reductase [Anaerovoracaceae bacterium]|jgi:epoxyqueuosine reductase